MSDSVLNCQTVETFDVFLLFITEFSYAILKSRCLSSNISKAFISFGHTLSPGARIDASIMAIDTDRTKRIAIDNFFKTVSVPKRQCDNDALDRFGGNRVVPVDIQGDSSYTVYAGHWQDKVVQYRPHDRALSMRIASLARQMHGEMVPQITAHGAVHGDDGECTENNMLWVYSMPRVNGITYLEYLCADKTRLSDEERRTFRRGFIKDVAE